MFIAKYKLEKYRIEDGATSPFGIKNGGYWPSPIDNTLLGWYENPSSDEFYLRKSDIITKITKKEIIDRALQIHSIFPFKTIPKYIDNLMNFDPSFEERDLTISEVVDLMSKWCDDFYNENAKSSTGYIVSNDDVNQERERRIEAGCNVSISGKGTIYVTGSEKDIRNMSGLGQGAIVRIINNDSTITNFRDGNNNMYALSPQQMLELWQKSAGYISAIYQASWTLKAMNPIPNDFVLDNYWPSNNL